LRGVCGSYEYHPLYLGAVLPTGIHVRGFLFCSQIKKLSVNILDDEYYLSLTKIVSFLHLLVQSEDLRLIDWHDMS
jgi:hypothetical protein